METLKQIRDVLAEAGLTRMSVWLVLAVVTSVAIFIMYPAQLGVILAAINKLAIGAWLGYVVDRFAFPYARPHTLSGTAAQSAQMRRALILAGAMLAMALGV